MHHTTTGLRLTLALAAGLAFAATSALTADLPPQVAALIPKAKAEGATATVFGLSIDPDQTKAYNAAISKFYGFPIDMKFVTGLHPQKAAQFIQQAKHGVPTGLDIFNTAPAIAGILDRGGLVADYDWVKGLGLDPSLYLGTKGMRAFDGTLTFVIYNTNLVKPADAPKSYEDLLDPKWKGRIAMPRSATPFIFLTKIMSEDKAADFAKRMVHDQQVRILPTFPDVGTRVASGEFALGLAQSAALLQKEGAPVAQAPVQPLLVTPWGLYLMKDARHPAMAKLYGYWLASEEGQNVLEKENAQSRVDAKGSALAKFAEGKKVIVLSYEFMNGSIHKLVRKFGAIMQHR